MRKEKSPKVSVLMLTYNQQEFIEQAIRSVLNQRVDFDYEIVIADDCSSDDTGLICRCMAAEHPEVITLLNANITWG